MQWSPEQRAHVGRVVRGKRIHEGYKTLAEFAERTGLNIKTLGLVEAGRVVADRTLITIEAALGWSPGSLDLVARDALAAPPGDQPDFEFAERVVELWRERLQEARAHEAVAVADRAQAEQAFAAAVRDLEALRAGAEVRRSGGSMSEVEDAVARVFSGSSQSQTQGGPTRSQRQSKAPFADVDRQLAERDEGARQQ